MKKYAPGVLLCLLISAPAWFLGKAFPVVGGPVFAILIGMAMAPFIKGKEAFRPGVAFASKKILQYAVILLGFSMNLATVLQKGREALPIILATISTSLVIAYILSKTLRLPGKTAILIGVGSSICGGSAIAATAPVIDADDSEIAQSISVIFFFNIIAALLFPALGSALGLSNEGFGLFAGTAINDTSSVTAAASAWDGMHGSNTLEAATIVKLTRTLAIIPITLFLACYKTGKEKKTSERSISIGKVFPSFVLFFLLASIITTAFPIPAGVTGSLKDLSKLFIVMAMGAIGTNTDLIKLIRTGKKPLLLGFCCWLGISVVSLALQVILGIW
ncbi:MAG: YeiH family protein [Hungatella sp.]|jgi:uncharacterized integral membrane protein (TIGR00698 family)|nr:YeiH family protein [Hungatella sp.]